MADSSILARKYEYRRRMPHYQTPGHPIFVTFCKLIRDPFPDAARATSFSRIAAAAGRAYAPYSGLRVGAAGLTDDGRIIVGSNVENASFGLTLCAECGLVSALHGPAPDGVGPGGPHGAGGGGRGRGRRGPLLPCGRCRQLLLEAGGGNLLVDTADGPVELKVLLPPPSPTSTSSQRREPRREQEIK